MATFDETRPASGTPLASSEIRENFIALKEMITITTVAVPPDPYPTLNTDNIDIVTILDLGVNISDMSENLSGTPSPGDMLLYRIKDDGIMRSINWGNSFESYLETLPTITTVNKELAIIFFYRDKWGCVYSGSEN
jgi:hypothetical protein